MNRVFPIVAIVFLSIGYCFAQFSPGDLSKAHEKLEGTNNCTQCHEVGNEISGKKCLTCHAEIKQQLDLKRGFHYNNSSQQCVTCHKEHLGRESRTYKFEAETFDHSRTGYPLAEKHSKLKCEQCHTPKNIHDELVSKILTDVPHKTYLGLSQACNSCHDDIHKGRFKADCSSCHTSSAWKPASKFNHATSAFKLEGKHSTVACAQCHPTLTATPKKLVAFMTKNFSDCSPCHSTPHGSKFSGRTCKSCHTTESWKKAMKKSFDHSLTAFQLVGKHVKVTCDQCHRPAKKGKSTKSLRIPFQFCTDCHQDKHNGEFVQRYNNNCTKCHNEFGYKPSLFTLVNHEESRFKLTGAHIATICSSCHKSTPHKPLTFHRDNLKCESCHTTPHGSTFQGEIKNKGCESCHSTEQWKTVAFDHSTTTFPLLGKHNDTPCSKCHKNIDGKHPEEAAPVDTTCESCHTDVHQRQFAVANRTPCADCHKPESWKMLIFNHEIQSSFSLKGAHAKVECRACHHEEVRDGVKAIHFKPLSTQCESCHDKLGGK